MQENMSKLEFMNTYQINISKLNRSYIWKKLLKENYRQLTGLYSEYSPKTRVNDKCPFTTQTVKKNENQYIMFLNPTNKENNDAASFDTNKRVSVSSYKEKSAISRNTIKENKTLETAFQSQEKAHDSPYNSKIEFISSSDFILSTELNLPNQIVVKADCKRTRTNEVVNFPFIQYLEVMLTQYCQRNRIKYKQGLNELLAPFLLLKKEENIELHEIYNLFTYFVEIYVPTFYLDEEFLSLQCDLTILKLLLRYHDPELALYLEKQQMTPEIYATPWLLTMFAKYVEKIYNN